MDRGFLFGDGLYEVIPIIRGKFIGFDLHLARLKTGAAAIELEVSHTTKQLYSIGKRLINECSSDYCAMYIQLSRGVASQRHHHFPETPTPTVFAYLFDVEPGFCERSQSMRSLKVTVAEDMRWRRCNIKSTSLLGNVLHHQQGRKAGMDETLLFNADGHLTEASACNVFVIHDNKILTPVLDNQLLPGITRHILLNALHRCDEFSIEERAITKDEVFSADEVWLTSSSKEIAPVSYIDSQPVGDISPGPVWLRVAALFNMCKYDFGS